MTDVAWAWDGDAVAGTSTLGAVWAVQSWDVGDVVAVPEWAEQQVLDIRRPRGDTHLGVERAVRLVIKATVSGVTGANTQRKLYDAWAELASFWSPLLGVKKLQATRTNGAGDSVVRYLLAQVMGAPGFAFRMSKPQGIDGPGAYTGASGHIIYPVHLVTACPYWVIATLLDQDTSPADAELAVGASPDTVTINNPGDRWVGAKFLYGSNSGSVTGVTIENTTNGDTLTIDKGSAFANGDYVAWNEDMARAVDPDDMPVKLNNLRIAGGGKMRLDPGNNTLECTRDAGSGTGIFSLTWPSLHLSF